jgi:hypothetical protein
VEDGVQMYLFFGLIGENLNVLGDGKNRPFQKCLLRVQF